ncbi:methyltransferase family protein [Candidatus Electrothrix sp.]|uniref:methyltransferase family protein n=1 Tax=Candidatus Electrothrix sp. TaxID=2170559 RepID=UPI004055B891
MALLIAGWILWCTLHSLLITRTINRWVREQGGLMQGGYRFTYSLFSFLSLIPLLWYQYSLPQEVIFTWSGWLRIPQGLLLLYAVLMCYAGYRVYDMKYLVGIRQWQSYQHNTEFSSLPFRCDGALAYVRHPWYSSGFPILWAFGPITDANLPVRIILTLYLIIGTVLEERKLVQELGEPYVRYQQQVPMLIPWKGRVSF